MLSEFIPVILIQNQPLDHKLFTRLSPHLIYLFVSMESTTVPGTVQMSSQDLLNQIKWSNDASELLTDVEKISDYKHKIPARWLGFPQNESNFVSCELA